MIAIYFGDVSDSYTFILRKFGGRNYRSFARRHIGRQDNENYLH